MKREVNQFDVIYGNITFSADFIDLKSYKPGTKKITSENSGRSNVTGYMIYDVVAIKETLDFTLCGLTDEVLAQLKEYLLITHEAMCTYPAAITGGTTKTKLMYVGSDLNEELQCVDPDGTMIWKLPLSFVEM